MKNLSLYLFTDICNPPIVGCSNKETKGTIFIIISFYFSLSASHHIFSFQAARDKGNDAEVRRRPFRGIFPINLAVVSKYEF